MNEKILVIHPCSSRTGAVTFQHMIKYLDVNILTKPTDQTEPIWHKLFKEPLLKNKYYKAKIVLENQQNSKKMNYHKLRNDFKDYLKSFFKNQKKISVLSDTGLLGQFGDPDPRHIDNLYIFKDIIEEIKNELNIKIIIKFIITIREQHSWILSIYHQGYIDLLSKENYGESYSKHMSIEDFFKRIIQSENYRNLFDHTLIVKRIRKVFNSEILTLPVELLKKDKEKYIYKICKFINLEVNINEKLIHLQKAPANKNYIIKDGRKIYFLQNIPFSRIFYLALIIHNWLKKIKIYNENFRKNILLKIIYKIVRPKSKRVFVNQQHIQKNRDLFQNEIKNLYKDSNLELEKITNTNLKELGYY